MNDQLAERTFIERLKIGYQQKIGDGYLIEAITDLSPIMAEVKIRDQASGRLYAARLYLTGEAHHAYLNQAWRMASPEPGDPPRKLPQPSFGLRVLGEIPAHVAAHIPGLDLAAYLKAAGPSGTEFTARLGVQLIKTLQILEKQDCFHYHIKPSEIVIAKEGHIVLKNAGLSLFENSIAQKSDVAELFDVQYAAPEQLNGSPLSAATEMYQVGLTLYEMAAGRPPFTGGYEQVKDGHLNQMVPNPQSFNPNVEVGVARVLAKALAKDPKQRFRDLAEFKQVLEFLLPAMERSNLAENAQDPQKLTEKEQARIAQQIQEAHGYASKRDFNAALRIIEALVMVSGPINEAVALYRKIWQAMYGAEIQEAMRKAIEAHQRGRFGEALSHLNRLFSRYPSHPKALGLQAAIFDKLAESAVSGSATIPLRLYQKKATAARSENNPLLAETLLTRLMLAPEGEDAKANRNLQFDKQLAAPELAALQVGRAPAKPIVKEPVAAPVKDLDLSELDQSPPRPVQASPPATGKQAAEPEEDLLEDPFDEAPLQPAAEPAPRPKKKAMLIAAIVVSLMVVAAIGAGIVFWKKKQFRQQASNAYEAAAMLEDSGDWLNALKAWRQVTVEFPNVAVGDVTAGERAKILEYKIKDREKNILLLFEKAETLLADETPIEEMDDNPVNYLNRILELDPGNKNAATLMETVHTRLSARAWRFWEEKKTTESRETYRFMVAINPAFRDQELEGQIEAWRQTNVIDPEMAKLDREIKRKRWDNAFEISRNLRELLDDPQPLNEKWNAIYAEQETILRQAQEKEKWDDMLAALEIMTEIRPDNGDLRQKINELNRSRNLKKILDMEKSIKNALDKKNYQTAGAAAVKLQKLESDNKIAKDAIGEVRHIYETTINREKKDNARAALQAYNTLVSLLNWKSHRTERDKLKVRVEQFDREVSRLKKQPVKDFEARHKGLDRMLTQYGDFARDDQHRWLVQIKAALESDHQRFKTLISWEESARNDVTKTYSEILTRLSEEKAFRFDYAKDRVASLKKEYQDLNLNYQGGVTLVIKGARNLPRGKGAFSKDPKGYCRLKTSGQTFTTEVAGANRNPIWSFTCNYASRANSPLVFTVFNKKGNEEIGSITLASVPENGRDITLTAKNGDWSLIIDVKRER